MPSIDNIHQDRPQDSVQAVFAGLNAVDPPHLIGQDEVQTATNIDFTLEAGGAACRRGSKQVVAITTATVNSDNLFSVDFLNSSEGAPADTDGVIYAAQGNVLYRSLNGTVAAISTASGAGSSTWAHTAYGSFAYFQGGDGSDQVTTLKDDGTNVTEWILESPPNPVHAVLNTMTPVSLLGTLTASEGAAVGTTGLVFSCDSTTFRLDVEQSLTQGLLSSNTTTLGTSTLTNTFGDYAVVSVQLAFSNPKNVNRISMDFGIGNAFNDYYHSELDVTSFAVGYPDPNVLVQHVNLIPVRVVGTTTISGQPISPAAYAKLQHTISTASKGATTRLSAAKQVLNTWLLPITNFQTIFQNANPGEWHNVGTARIVIEGTGSFTATLSNWQIVGATNYSLSDLNVGYQWWETWAQIDPNSGVIFGESAPCPPRVTLNKVQYCNATLTDTHTPTNPNSGITHRIWYRQGGYLGTPYAVATCTITTTQILDTMADMDVLALNEPMNTDVAMLSQLGRSPRSIASYFDRIFVLSSNTLSWSLPGAYAEFPNDSYVVMADGGDPGEALIEWLPRLVIVNDHSVYEYFGNFETGEDDFTLFKTGCKHGSKSRLVPIRTPYGIPLIDYDGIFMYTPGQGVENNLEWVMQKVGDMWLGGGTTDPAAYKGNRVPPINWDSIKYACSAYANQRLYLGLPTGTSSIQFCNTVLVIDFRYQKTFLYQYPFNFNNIYWDQFKNAVYVLTSGGNVKQIETATTDTPEGTGPTDIVYNFKTRSWPAPTDLLMENFAVQYRGGNSTLTGIYDQTNTATIGTLTSSNKVWTIPALLGSIANDVSFVFQGTQASGTQNVIYNLDWDLWVQPKKVTYYRTDYDDNGTTGEKIYDVHFTDMAIIPTGTAVGTVLATAFVDDVAISTYTLTGTTSEKLRYEFSYPPETYGNIAFTVYNASAATLFKLYGHHIGARNEPPRVTKYDSDRVTGSEQWWRELLSDVNPLGGTITATWYLDEVATATFTITNALSSANPAVGRDVFPNDIQAQEPYGTCAYVRYSATTPFKHYRTWYITEPQPDRLTFWESSHDTLPSVGVVKTWLAKLNPQGGTTTGTVMLDGVAVMTASFTGSVPNVFEVGLPNLTTGKTLKAVYTSTIRFKHWNTQFEVDPKPFYKTTWNVIYKKWGGATQLDMARFHEIDIETTNTATVTSTWFIDGTVFQTDTFTVTGRQYFDRVPFAPGGFGYLMQQEVSSQQPFHLWSNRLEIERVGIKGFTPVGIPGTPVEQQSVTPAEGQTTIKPWSTQYYV